MHDLMQLHRGGACFVCPCVHRCLFLYIQSGVSNGRKSGMATWRNKIKTLNLMISKLKQKRKILFVLVWEEVFSDVTRTLALLGL